MDAGVFTLRPGERRTIYAMPDLQLSVTVLSGDVEAQGDELATGDRILLDRAEVISGAGASPSMIAVAFLDDDDRDDEGMAA